MKKVVLEIIRQSEDAGAYVDVLSSDMGPNNVSMMNKLGFGVQVDKKGKVVVKNKIRHPLDPSRNLYLVYDVPHVEKNIANGWRTYREIKLSRKLRVKYGFPSDAAIDIKFVSSMLSINLET